MDIQYNRDFTGIADLSTISLAACAAINLPLNNHVLMSFATRDPMYCFETGLDYTADLIAAVSQVCVISGYHCFIKYCIF